MKNKLQQIIFTSLILIVLANFGFAQTDTLKSAPPDTNKAVIAPPPSANEPTKDQGKLSTGEPNLKPGEKMITGVAVSPSKVIFTTKQGKVETKEIKITNDSKLDCKFQVGFTDFMQNRRGKSVAINENSELIKYALSKKLTVSPTFIEVLAGQSKSISVTLNVPITDAGAIAGWTLVTIDQVVERKALDFKGDDKTIALGVIPSIGFGIYIYHNPPNVKNQNVELEKFALKDSLGKKAFTLMAHNVGDGIGFCVSYCEVTSLTTWKSTKLNRKAFTILPGSFRDFDYELPADLPKGKYNAVGVVDFGNDTEVKAVELEFEIN